MRNIITATILIITFNSCWPEFIDPSLHMYVQSFREEGYKRGMILRQNNVSVRFGDLTKQDYLGLTIARPRKGIKVIIDTDWYKQNKDNPLAVELLMYHELGHALLDREHLDTPDKKTRIMNTYICVSCYTEQSRDQFIEDLFNNN